VRSSRTEENLEGNQRRDLVDSEWSDRSRESDDDRRSSSRREAGGTASAEESRALPDHVRWAEELRRKEKNKLRREIEEREAQLRRIERGEARLRAKSAKNKSDRNSRSRVREVHGSPPQARRRQERDDERRGSRQRGVSTPRGRSEHRGNVRKTAEGVRGARPREDWSERRRSEYDEPEGSSEGEGSHDSGGEGGSTLRLLDTPRRRRLTTNDLVTEMGKANEAIRDRRRRGKYEPTGAGTPWSVMLSLAGSLDEWSREEPRRAGRTVETTLKAQRGSDWTDRKFNFQKACGEANITRSFDGGSGRAQKRRLRVWLAEVRSYLETRRVPLGYWFSLLKAWVTQDRSLVMELRRIEDLTSSLVKELKLAEELETAFMFLEAWGKLNLRAGTEDAGETLGRVTGCTPKRGESIGDLMVRLGDLVGDHNDRSTGMRIGSEETYRYLVGMIRKDPEIARVISQRLLREADGWSEMWRSHAHVVFSDSGRFGGSAHANARVAAYGRWPARRVASEDYRSAGRGQSGEFRRLVRNGDWFCRHGHLNFADPPKEVCYTASCSERKDQGGLEWPHRPGRYTAAEINEILGPYGRKYAFAPSGSGGRNWRKPRTQGVGPAAGMKGENERLKSHIGHLRDELAQMKGSVELLMKDRTTGSCGSSPAVK